MSTVQTIILVFFFMVILCGLMTFALLKNGKGW